jgi:parallel beta-helix repeat protein/predicted outer membrane repeat protein
LKGEITGMKRLFSFKFLLILSMLFVMTVSPVFAAEHVVTDLDGGYTVEGSLREILTNDARSGDVITFQDDLVGSINITGSILLTHDLTIQGPGADLITINGSFSMEEASLIMINAGVTAEISGLSLAGGSPSGQSGGAINNAGNLSLSGCVLSGNDTSNGLSGTGGAICNDSSVASMDIFDCLFLNNLADSGGAIYNDGDLSIESCDLTGNQALDSDADGGGLYNNSNGNLVIENCTFKNNIARNCGGGIYSYQSSGLQVQKCTFNSNSTESGWGGGLYIHSCSNATITNCTFSSNVAIGNAGGICNYNSSLTSITNCTLSLNYAEGEGGGIFNSSSVSPTIRNCILWGNNNGEIVNVSCTPEVSYCVVQSSDIGIGTISDHIITDDPMLESLGNNGGYTSTCAFGVGSSAIDAGTEIEEISKDQRGVSRPQGDGYDIGAYELVPEPVYYSITTISSAGGTIEPVSADVLEGTDKTFTVTVYDGYILSDLLDGDESVSADMVGNDYAFTNVEQDHTLSATFIIDPAMKEEAGVGDFQVEDEGIGSLSQGDLVPEEDITSLGIGALTSEDVNGFLEDEGIEKDNFISGVSFDVTYSNDEGNDIFALNVTLDLSREDLGQDTCDAIDGGEDLAEAFFKNVSIFKIVSPDAYDLFTVASKDQDLAEPVNFFEVTGDEESYHVSMSMVIEDNPVPEGESAVEAVVSGLDNYFYVYDGVTDGKFTDPLVAVRKSAVQEPPADDDDDVDDSDTTAETPASSGDGNCNVGAFPAAFGLLMVPLFFLLRR